MTPGPRPADAPRRTGGARRSRSTDGLEHADPGIPRDELSLDANWDSIRRVARATKAIAGDEIERVATPEPGVYGIPSFSDPERETYTVTTRPVVSCTCRDAAMRGNVCKHICSALLLERDREAIELAKWVDFLPEE